MTKPGEWKVFLTAFKVFQYHKCYSQNAGTPANVQL